MADFNDILKAEERASELLAIHKYSDAIYFHSKSIEIAEKLGRHKLQAALLNRLGRAYELSGNSASSVICFEHGLKILNNVPTLNLGDVLKKKRSMVKGHATGREELSLPDLFSPETQANVLDAENDPALPIKLLVNSGNSYLQRRQHASAQNDYELALEQPAIKDHPLLEGKIKSNLSVIKYREKETEAALELIDQAILIFDELGQPLEKRRVLAILGDIHRDLGEEEEAYALYQSSLILYLKAEDKRGLGRLQVKLAELELAQGNFIKAEKLFDKCISNAQQSKDKNLRWHAFAGLGIAQEKLGKLTDAIDSLTICLNIIGDHQQKLRTDEGKVSFLDSVGDIFDRLIELHFELENFEDALEVAENARSKALEHLMNGKKRRRIRGNGGFRSTRSEGFDLDNESSPMMQMSSSTLSIPPPEFPMMAQMAVGTQPSFIPSELFATEVEPEIEVPEMPPLARIVYHPLEDKLIIFAVNTDGKIQAQSVPLPKAQLSESVAQLRRSLKVAEEARNFRAARRKKRTEEKEIPYAPLLTSLYASLIQPVKEFLSENKTTVVIEPAGALWMLPFAALQSAEGVYLADEFPLLYSPAAKIMEEIRTEPDYGTPHSLSALVIGNPSMPQDIEWEGEKIQLLPLQGAEEEAKEIGAMFPADRVTVLSGKEATLTEILGQLTDHGILHLATHGVAGDKNPLESFVALADSDTEKGVLTARKVTELDIPADLVCLSACQTGLGKISGDGMIGLSRAFMIAGARAVLVSQWSVSDAATRILMTTFYEKYIELDDKAVALQLAMKKVREIPKYAHPKYWAAFTVVGAEA